MEEEKERRSSVSSSSNHRGDEGAAGGGDVLEKEEEEVVYKTKVIQFLGRSTPIVLQNDNGPCPLLAICNVLLLRNSLHLSLDAPEVSLQKLLSLVAEKLIDSNSNTQDKDDGYLLNQQQNIADAIDLLPRLSTGIDVNVQFRKINDFEFTPECAIFDLLGIALYHGWIVDPQDIETASAIGSKSYNTLVGELVAGDACNSPGRHGDDSVDFAAATTAALGVPSPCLSRGRSFEDCPVPVCVPQESRKGDREEADELMRALNLSKAEMSIPINMSSSLDAETSRVLDGSGNTENPRSGSDIGSSANDIGLASPEPQQIDLFAQKQLNASIESDNGLYSNILPLDKEALSSVITNASNAVHLVPEVSGEYVKSSDTTESVRNDLSTQCPSFQCIDEENCNGHNIFEGLSTAPREETSATQTSAEDIFTSQNLNTPTSNHMPCDSPNFAVQEHYVDGSSDSRRELPNVSEVGCTSLDESEPIYEGEECILDSGVAKYADQEPIYEGEIMLAQQADKMEDTFLNSTSKVDLRQCRLIRNFLESSASQLTIYGLFCLQEGLKERELCVFFRNNHFNTMFKFNGELYLLATDQGYINQPDLVWEKLNEVNGDTIFMTGNFTEFKIENQVSESWNEQNAMTTTADYLATLEASAPTDSSFSSDLQLAIALQQQEFGQQSQQQTPQRSQQQSLQQTPASGRSRLVTGPQVPSRSSQAPPKKDKCIIM